MKNNGYETSDHCIYSCKYHIIFCPKYRRHLSTSDIQDELKQLIIEKQDKYGYKLIEQEIMTDHVHLLISTSPFISINNIVSKIKGYSSYKLRRIFNIKARYIWSRSRFISTVGAVSLDTVKSYIENQKVE